MKNSTVMKIFFVFGAFVGAVILVTNLISLYLAPESEADLPPTVEATAPLQTPDDEEPPEQEANTDIAGAATESDDPEVTEDPEETDEPEEPEEPVVTDPPFEPYAVEETQPHLMLASSHIMSDGVIVDSFLSPERIDFGRGDAYSLIEGVTTFRGNNFRDSASYGYANIRNGKFGETWTRGTGSLTAPDGATWTGHGWSGQPLIVKWPKQTRDIMNLYSWAKEREELVEVIYPAMDGFVYFSELESGAATRDKLYIGYTFKGAGAVDPRGYPLLYVGAGYASSRGVSRIFIISLVDGSVLHTFGYGDGFAHRNWTAADAAPLVDAENDKLIYPSENGVLYIIDLNSEFDLSEGTMKISPSAPTKWRFRGIRSHVGGKYWLGFESSPAIWQGHIFMADNGGHLICLDLNTLEPVWVRDVLDDTNNTPVISIEDGRPYVYISTGFHGGWRAPGSSAAVVPIWKLDAATGEVVWQTDYMCYTSDGVSGGVQGTIAMGKHDLGDFIFVPVARTPTRSGGVLAALNKITGEIVWEFKTNTYSWSSPVCVYDGEGNGYIVYANAAGNLYLLNGLTGELLDTIQLGGTVEASPAVYDSTAVVGTRSCKIWGVRLT